MVSYSLLLPLRFYVNLLLTTGSLGHFLRLHPMIRKASGEKHFFDTDSEYSNGLEHYRKQMPYSYPQQITLEKSPRYFRTPSAAERIHKFNKTIKLLLIVRDPTTRLVSEYAHRVAMGR